MAPRRTLARRSSRRTLTSKYDARKQEASAFRRAGPVKVYVDPTRIRPKEPA